MLTLYYLYIKHVTPLALFHILNLDYELYAILLEAQHRPSKYKLYIVVVNLNLK